MVTKVQDTFTDTDGVDLSAHTPDVDVVGNGWNDEGANQLEILGNQLRANGNSQDGWIDTGISDCYVETEFNAQSGDNRGAVSARGDNANGGGTQYDFVWRTGADTLTLYAVVAGVPTEIATKSYTINSANTYKYAIETLGTTIRALVDDAEELSTTDSSITTGTYLKLIHAAYVGSGGRFDNILARDPITNIFKTVNDSAVANDTINGPSSNQSITDTGAGSDQNIPTAQLSMGDKATALDAINLAVLNSVQESGMANDSLTSVVVTFAIQDNGFGLEVLDLITATLKTATDTGMGLDSVAGMSSQFIATDSATGATQLIVSALMSIADAGAGVESINAIKQLLKQVADSAGGLEAINIVAAIQTNDIASTNEIALINSLLSVADSLSGLDAAARFDVLKNIASLSFSLARRSMEFTFKTRSMDFTLIQ